MGNECESSVVALKWDTEFFGFKVGALKVHGQSVQDITKALLDTDQELVYVFLDDDVASGKETFHAIGGKYVGRRIALRKQLDQIKTDNSIVLATHANSALEELAFLSGWKSRFNCDKRLHRYFKPMYRIWLENELKNGKVFVWPTSDAPLGMVTVGINGSIGKIGLLAVAQCARRNGIGARLLDAAFEWLVANGVLSCELVTQGENKAAMSFYQKRGFKVVSSEEVYHVWREK